MQEAFATFLIIFSTLLPVLDPFGGCMFFLALTPNITDEQRAFMVRRIIFFSTVILFSSLFAGHLILNFFGISMGILRVCGGIILASTGWHTMTRKSKVDEIAAVTPVRTNEELVSMAFYPITLPLTMGPGVISIATALGTGIFTDGLYSFIGLLMAALAALATVFVCYRYCDRIGKAAGPVGSEAISRTFGFILTCIGTGVLWKGVSELLPTLF